MASIPDEVTQTIPRRGAPREAPRVPVLLLAGTAAVVDPLNQAGISRRVVAIEGGADIGRRPAPAADGRCTLVLHDKSVSSLHARILKTPAAGERPESFEIQDLGSTNGTSVDGRAVTGPTPLRTGAVIFLGAQVVVFRMVTPAEIAAIEEDA